MITIDAEVRVIATIVLPQPDAVSLQEWMMCERVDYSLAGVNPLDGFHSPPGWRREDIALT